MAERGTYVLIHKIILEPAFRAPQVPDDTRSVPLEMWIKGYLQGDAEIGEQAEIITRTGRKETGILQEENPYYKHNYGTFVPELLSISEQVREILFGGDAK